MIQGGREYERVDDRDEKQEPPREENREQAKIENELAKRKNESPAEQARYLRERTEERTFIREIPDAFAFRLVKTDTVSNQPAWVIEAQPKPGYRAAHSRAKDFAKVRATIWIEQATYHWVKVEADVLSTISGGFGVLRVAPGA